MKPWEFIAQNGIDFFQAQKGKTVTVRLLSDDELVFSGYFGGITRAKNEIPIMDGYILNLPQFNLHFMIKEPKDGRMAPISVNLLMIDSMADIKFSENKQQ